MLCIIHKRDNLPVIKYIPKYVLLHGNTAANINTVFLSSLLVILQKMINALHTSKKLKCSKQLYYPVKILMFFNLEYVIVCTI